MYDIAVIGCGITGAAIAYELSKYRLKTAVFEKNNDVADETTKANSAILHAGYDPKPGTLMASLNVRGAALAKQLCRDLEVPYKNIGSLLIAFSKEEVQIIHEIYARGQQNQVPGLEILSKEQLLALEPELNPEVFAGLYAPTAAIVNPWEYAMALAETAYKNEVDFFLCSEVEQIQKKESGYQIFAGRQKYTAKVIINAAGLYADKIHDMVLPHAYNIVPVRGEYYIMDKIEGSRARHVLFQTPSKAGKGVLVSPTVDGNLLAGPNAEPILEDVKANTLQGLADVKKYALKTVPGINFQKSIRNFAGLRAVPEGYADFIIKESGEHFIDVAGIQSPGLTAAPAIAEYVAALLKKSGIEFNEKKEVTMKRKRRYFSSMSAAEKNQMIQKNAAYGNIVCRCEQVTEGEIIEALRRPLAPATIDGVKRRCNAGMGRCQGGFCSPKVMEIICRERNLSPFDVCQDKENSNILIKVTGEEDV